MHLDKIYNFCLKHLSKYSLFAEVNEENHEFMGFLWLSQ